MTRPAPSSGPPSILVLTSTFPRRVGDSTPCFVYDLCRLAAQDFHIVVLAPHHPGAARGEQRDGLDIRRFVYFRPSRLEQLCYEGGMLPRLRASWMARLQLPPFLVTELVTAATVARRERVALVHAHWILPQGLIGALLKRLWNLPLLVTVHGSDVFALTGRASRALERMVLEIADGITANSEATVRELRRLFPNVAHKIRLLPMGVDLDRFHPPLPPAPRDPETILFVGRLGAQKGVDTLLDAMPRVLAARPSARLRIVGAGPLAEPLGRRAARNDLGRSVEWVGALSHEELAERYRSSAVFVMPSRAGKDGTEALGLTVLEAMASSCPVVASDVGGMSALLGDDERGLRVTPADADHLARALTTCLEQPAAARARADAALRFVTDTYDWMHVRDSLVGLYAELAAGRR